MFKYNGIKYRKMGAKDDTMHLIYIGKLKIIHYDNITMFKWNKGNIHILPDLLKPFKWSLSKLRKLFPYCLAVGLHDCDSGGQICQWYYPFYWNYWTMKKDKNLGHSGDGPDTIHRMSYWQFFKIRQKERRNYE